MFAFVCLTLLLPLLSIYSFVSISGQNAIFSCKDTAATTIAVKLFIRTIIMLLLLTLKILFYSRELSLQQFFVDNCQFEIERFQSMIMAPPGNEAIHTFRPTTLNNC